MISIHTNIIGTIALKITTNSISLSQWFNFFTYIGQPQKTNQLYRGHSQFSDQSWFQKVSIVYPQSCASLYRFNALCFQDSALIFTSANLWNFISKMMGNWSRWEGIPFSLQRITAINCRWHLWKWHRIEKGRPLKENEIGFVMELVMGCLRPRTVAGGGQLDSYNRVCCSGNVVRMLFRYFTRYCFYY